MELVFFIVTAVLCVGAAIAMLLSHNAVHSALWLVLNFFGVAVLYLLLNAPFLAMVQITVYAGAIMVLFLFVIMLLGSEKGQEEFNGLPWETPVALVLGLVLLGMAGFAIFGADQPALPAQVPNVDLGAVGAPEAVAVSLFSTYLLPFEATSILLLVALIGAVVLTIKSREGAR